MVGAMQVRVHTGAQAFLDAGQDYLRSDPYSASVLAVVAERVASGTEAAADDHLWLTVEEAGHVVGMAMHTPPWKLFVSRMPHAAAVLLAHTVAEAGRRPRGVTGAVRSTAAFAEAWASCTGSPSSVVTAMRMYRLERLLPPTGVPGQAAQARREEAETVARWVADFHAEAQPQAPVQNWLPLVEGRIAAGEVHVWHDGAAPVAMAAVSAPAAGVARVGPVYTPPGSRRRGYGAAVTAVATAAALDGGAQHVALYTDLANPTSNSIYQAIGYRPHHDAEERVFEPADRQE